MSASTAVSFSINEDEKIATILKNGPEIARVRVAGIVAEHKDAKGANLANEAELQDLRSERDALNTKIGATELEEQRSGLRTGSHRSVTDDDGVEHTEFVPSPEMARWKKRLAEVNARIRVLGDQNFPSVLGRVNRALVQLAPDSKLVAEDLPDLAPPKGSPDEPYKAALTIARRIERDLKETWEKPRTIAEMKDGVVAAVAALAERGKPRLGGFRRAFDSINNVRRVSTSPEIGFQTVALSQYGGLPARIDVLDSAALFAYANRDALTAQLLADLEKDFDDTGTMSAADKSKAIKKLEHDLWIARHVVEARFLQARAFGTKLLRPERTPVPVLLGVKNFMAGRDDR